MILEDSYTTVRPVSDNELTMEPSICPRKSTAFFTVTTDFLPSLGVPASIGAKLTTSMSFFSSRTRGQVNQDKTKDRVPRQRHHAQYPFKRGECEDPRNLMTVVVVVERKSFVNFFSDIARV